MLSKPQGGSNPAQSPADSSPTVRRAIPPQPGGPSTGANPAVPGARGDVRPGGGFAPDTGAAPAFSGPAFTAARNDARPGGSDTGANPAFSPYDGATQSYEIPGGAHDPAGGGDPAEPAATPVKSRGGRKDLLLAGGIYLVNLVVAALWSYDLFGKFFDLVKNRCSAKRDFTVECIVERPPAQGLWGLLIGGGGLSLALVAALILIAVAAMTNRRTWIYPALALPVIAITGAIGHFLVGSAIG
ncbi:hypothetical protein ABZ319_25915 [Nocardia sp. NPDC005978]|uniref:hypothetical protein n=1 Tax=Nocardia sp. NPDC005978 TaxID=3156725 RepID=UPI0033A8C6C7